MLQKNEIIALRKAIQAERYTPVSVEQKRILRIVMLAGAVALLLGVGLYLIPHPPWFAGIIISFGILFLVAGFAHMRQPPCSLHSADFRQQPLRVSTIEHLRTKLGSRAMSELASLKSVSAANVIRVDGLIYLLEADTRAEEARILQQLAEKQQVAFSSSVISQ